GGPVAAGAGAVFLAGDDDQRRALGDVLHRGVVDRHDFAVRHVAGDAALGAGRHLVLDARVGEGAAHHDLMVAAARAVGVELLRPDLVLGQVGAGRAGLLDVAGGGDVVG